MQRYKKELVETYSNQMGNLCNEMICELNAKNFNPQDLCSRMRGRGKNGLSDDCISRGGKSSCEERF